MRVAHILSYASERYAGVPIATRKLGFALKSIGVNTTLWATKSKRAKQSLLENNPNILIFNRRWPHIWFYSPNLSKNLNKTADEYDLFHIHEVWNHPQFVASRIAQQKKIPYIWSPRAALEPWRMQYKGLKKKIYFKIFGQSIMRHSCCMHAVSEGEAIGFRKLGYHGPITVIPNGVIPEEFSSLPDAKFAEEIWPTLKNRIVVLFLSRLSPEKGLNQLLPAWADIVKRKHSKDPLLVLAGPDDRGYRRVLDDMCISYNLKKHVLFTDFVSGFEKSALLSRSDIYVLPSYSEGFSNSLLENFAAGTPALITPGCHFPEAVKAGAAIIVNPDKDEIAEGLTLLIDMSKCELRRIGINGRNLVMRSFTWELAARRIMTVYQAILNNETIPFHPEPAELAQ
jgi:glycosyltransferase involved in cell wall biosynthesis